MDLGKRIAFFRVKQGLNQRDFAEVLDTTEVSINRWENNKSVPRAKAKKAMADLFGVTVEDLDEAPTSININEISLHRATVVRWLRDKHESDYALTLVTRTGHFNMIIARASKERFYFDVLTGAFDLSDVLPLIREGVINTFCQPSGEIFNRLRLMQLRDTELFDLLCTAERFESNEVYSKLLDDGFAENADEAILIEKWRRLSMAQRKAIMVTIDIKLAPKEHDDAELNRLIEKAQALEDFSDQAE